MQQHLQAIVTVLSLVNPLICGAMFAQIEAGQTSATRLADATNAALAVLVILVIAALVGARVLHIFGVSLDAFSVAGGGVLAWIGFSMLRGKSAPVPNAAGDQKRSLTPLILFAASPGTITGVITVAVVHTKLLLPVTALSSSGGHRRNVDHDGTRGPRGGNSRRRRASAQHGDAVHGADRHCHGHAVRADRPSRFFRSASLIGRKPLAAKKDPCANRQQGVEDAAHP
jgi:multiple antibiotic resistance protein